MFNYTEHLEILNEAKKILKNIPSDILALKDIFYKNKYELYVVGGAVRDSLLGKSPKDWDLATNATPDDMIKILKSNPIVKNILEVGKSFGVLVVITTDNNEYEIATFRSDNTAGRRPDSVTFTTIENDVLRRDLTINALFYDLNKQEIVDLVGGIDDLKSNRIRTVGKSDERFDEDALRKLRAIRFAARLNSKLDSDIDKSLKTNNSLQGVSSERIISELKSGIKNSKTVKFYFELLNNYNYFDIIFPNLNVSLNNVIESKTFELCIASILINNEPNDDFIKKLKKLNFDNTEIYNIVFLLTLKNLQESPYKIKIFELSKTKLSPTDIELFMKKVYKFKPKLVNAYKIYKITTNGNDLLKQGFKGKELGIELERIENELFYSLYENKIIFDWSDVLNEGENIDVVLSQHGEDRSRERYGLPVNIKREDVEKLVQKSADILTNSYGQFKTFVLHGMKSNLNVVGALIRKGYQWVFKVITLMVKPNFKAKPDDKYIKVFEIKQESETFEIYKKVDEIVSFADFFKN